MNGERGPLCKLDRDCCCLYSLMHLVLQEELVCLKGTELLHFCFLSSTASMQSLQISSGFAGGDADHCEHSLLCPTAFIKRDFLSTNLF